MSFRARVVDLVESFISVAWLPILAPRSETLQLSLSRGRLAELDDAFYTASSELTTRGNVRSAPLLHLNSENFGPPQRQTNSKFDISSHTESGQIDLVPQARSK